MKLAIIIAIPTLLIAVGLTVFLMTKRKSKRQQPERFREDWLAIQRLCASKETWRLAVINADRLLDSALRKKHFRGKSMGERLVAAQHQINDNDSIWYAHNLAKKLLADASTTLREAEAKKSLVGVRQALRDLGMLDDKH